MRDLTNESPGALCFNPALTTTPQLEIRRKKTTENADDRQSISSFSGLVICPRWIQPTFDAVAECVEHEHDIACLRGNKIGALIRSTLSHQRTASKREQFRRHNDDAACFALAKQLVWAKTAGQYAIMRRYAQRRNDPALTERAERIKRDRLTINRAKNLNELRGSEGIIARTYFGGWPRLLSLPDFQRVPRRALNPINHLLDLCYSRLCLQVTTHVLDAQLDLGLGTLHSDDDRRPTLALDLMEPLRPLIADRFVINVYRDALDGEWFTQTQQRWHLTPTGRARWRQRWQTWYYGGKKRLGQNRQTAHVISTYQDWIANQSPLNWLTVDDETQTTSDP